MIVITKVKVELVDPYKTNAQGIVGFANIVINNSIFLSSIAIHKKLNAKGYRLTYPTKGKFEIFYPIQKEVAKQIEEEIFTKLEDVIAERLCQSTIQG